MHLVLSVSLQIEQQRHLTMRLVVLEPSADVGAIRIGLSLQVHEQLIGHRLLEQQAHSQPVVVRAVLSIVTELGALATSTQCWCVGRVHSHCSAPQLMLGVCADDDVRQRSHICESRQHVDCQGCDLVLLAEIHPRWLPEERPFELHRFQQLLDVRVEVTQIAIALSGGVASQLQQLRQQVFEGATTLGLTIPAAACM